MKMSIKSIFIQITFTCVFLFCFSAAYAKDKPNVVLMLSDNIGYGDIGAFQGGALEELAHLSEILRE